MKRNFTFLIAAVALLVGLALPLGVWGQASYTITSNTGSGDGTTIATSTSVTDVFTNGDYASAFTAADRAWYAGSDGLKLGASSNGGTLTFNLTNAGQVSPTSIVVNAKRYNSNKAATLSVNNAAAQDVTAEWSDLTFNITTQITSISLSSSKYIWINTITVNYTSGGGTPTTYTVTYAAGDHGTGTMTDDNSPYQAGAPVTLLTNTFTPDNGYQWDAWEVKDANNNTITVNNGSFNMPASNVTVTAQWTQTGGSGTSNVTYTITSTSSVSTSGTAPTDSEATFSNTYSNNKFQLTSGNSMTLTLTGYQGLTVKRIVLSMHSNKSAGAGWMYAKAGNTTLASIGSDGNGVAFNNNQWYGSYTQDFVDVEINMSNTTYPIQTDENLVIFIKATTNSLFCQSFTIYYETASVNPIITFDPNAIALLDYVTVGQEIQETFTVAQSNLTADINLTATAGSLNPSTIQQGSSTTQVTWTYTPAEAGSITETITATSGTLSETLNITGTAKACHSVSTGSIAGQGQLTYSTNSAIEGTSVTVTATPATGYYLYDVNATPTDGLTLHTDGTFTFAMPDENVNVNATFNQVSPMTVTEALAASLPFDPFHYVCVTGVVTGFYGSNTDITTDTYHRYYIAVDNDSEDQLLVYNGTGLDHAAFSDANDLMVGDQVVVWGELIDYTSNDNTVREIAKGNYIMSLERPVIMEYYQYSINGVEGDVIEIASGTEITLPSTVETVPTGFTFAGWTTNANDVEHVFAAGSSYTINETVEFFAVFAKDLGSTAFSFVITPSDFNKTSYNANNGDHTSEATTTTGETMDVTWSSSNVMLSNDNEIQFRRDPKGSISAVNLGTITNVVIEETSTDALSIDYNDGSFTIENNGSATGYATSVTVTFTTNVTGYYTRIYTQVITGYGEDNDYGYTLIASPIDGVNPANVAGMTEGNFDLYRFNESAELEWENWKQTGDHNHFNLERGKGYLYAHKTDVTLAFAGTPVQGTTFNVTLTNSGTEYKGMNLVGNPFGQRAYVAVPFFVMNGEGSGFETAERNYVEPMEGIIVDAANGTTLTFTTEAPSNGGGSKVAINLSRNRGDVIDRAIVRFGEGSQLHKFQLRENSTKVYFTEGNQDFAVVRSQKAQGEMPVNFKAEENGTYTLSVNTEEMELNYLHLVDNMTGMDVDLLQTPSYTFDATTNDYASRFRLVFSANNVDGSSTGSETFAFYSNGNWVVNNEGEATLQVIDVNGRIVSNETINGTVATSINATPGVYMLRLVNGNEVKTQKIVVR